MENDENAYCRLCADLKLNGDLSNLETDVEKRREIFNKLARFNITLNLHNSLPKTVCWECVNNLNNAFDFVTTVDQAQEAFTDYIENTKIQKTEVGSDDENTDYEVIRNHDDDDYHDYDVSIKGEDKYSFEAIGEDIEIQYEIMKFEPNEEDSTLKPIILNTKKPVPRKKTPSSQEMELCESWNEYDWFCNYCGKYFDNVDQLRTHSMQFHTTCNVYTCCDCDTQCYHLDKFISHICRHRPFLILTCYKCSQKCFTMREMKLHKATHFNSDYFCNGCNTTFSSQNELDEHTSKFYKDKNSKDLANETENESLTCVICQKTLKNMLLLNRHLLIHTERKRDQVCKTCGKSFYNKKMLAQHIVVHSDERPHKCEVCKYSFKLLSELRKHVSVHFGSKSFSCDKCGKCFRRGKELTLHNLVHTGERPHVCSYCEKTFRFKHLLRQHIRLHTGVKPYTCDICPRDFRNWSNFNKHMKEQHGINKSKRRRMSDGLYALDPATGQVIYPEEDKLGEWKNEMLTRKKLGRPKKIEESTKEGKKG